MTSGVGSIRSIPAQVTLVPGAEYYLAGETYVFGAVTNLDGSTVGAVSGTAVARFSLQPVPEPSTLAVAALGTLAFSAIAWRQHRRS